MGLMYLFPDSDDEIIVGDRVLKNNDSIMIKTFGLPMIFWGYLAAIYTVIFAMYIATIDVFKKLFSYNDPSLTMLAILVKSTLLLSPIFLLGFFFYEKVLIKNKNYLTIIHKLFFIPVLKKEVLLDSCDSFIVEHFLDSPNVAKMQNKKELKGFENKGYFELFAISNSKAIYLDRHSRKVDLIKLKDILSKY